MAKLMQKILKMGKNNKQTNLLHDSSLSFAEGRVPTHLVPNVLHLDLHSTWKSFIK
jgi:hypothetical protein